MWEKDKDCDDSPYPVGLQVTWAWTCRSTFMPIFYENKYYSTTQPLVGLVPRCWTLRPEEPWVQRPTISYTLIFNCVECRCLNLPSPSPCRCSRDSCNVVIVNDKVSLWMLRGPKETLGMPISSRKASKRLLFPNISKRMLQVSKILRNALTGVR